MAILWLLTDNRYFVELGAAYVLIACAALLMGAKADADASSTETMQGLRGQEDPR